MVGGTSRSCLPQWESEGGELPSRGLQQENEVDTVLGKISQRRGRETSPDHSKDLEKEQTNLGFEFTAQLSL